MTRIREALEEAREWVAECAGKRFVVSTINPSELLAKIDAALASPAGKEIGVKALEEARFLVERLTEFDRFDFNGIEEAYKEYAGHVSPAVERLRSALTANPATVAEGEPVAWIDKAELEFITSGAYREATVFSYSDANAEPIALYAAAPNPPTVQPSGEDDLYRHKKRGTTYRLLGIGKMQATGWFEDDSAWDEPSSRSVDMDEVAIYRSEADGSLWVRPKEEFEDGRFEKVAPPVDGGGAK